MGPSVYAKGCRDNVGKDLVAAGTGNNLRRLRDRWEDLRTGERDRVWRMSP
jgi:hypothetical protein